MSALNRGVVLAGGLGTRMGELTRVINKHLLPVGDKPMIFYPIELLVKNGFDELLIVVGQKGCGELIRQLGDGSRFGAKFVFSYQEGNGGIADALKLAEPWVHNYNVFPVILGDNIFPMSSNDGDYVRDAVQEALYFRRDAHVFCAPVNDMTQFGCAVIDKYLTRSSESRWFIKKLIEKPIELKLNENQAALAVTGLYLYTPHVFQVIEMHLVPSQRNELEISDVNNFYAEKHCLHYSTISPWLDCGTPELYKQAQVWAEKNKTELMETK